MIIHHISKETGLNEDYLAKVIRTASHHYKFYEIEKRTGGKRKIFHPSKELKFIQRWLIKNLLNFLPIHDSVYSYRKNRNTFQLAKKHKNKNYLLRIDFKDFFPSIKGKDISFLINKNIDCFPYPLSSDDIHIIRLITCKDDSITIGAPSSPIISNSILYNFDKYWDNQCQQKGVTFTRYADDLYFSTSKKNVLEPLLTELTNDLKKRTSPKLEINKKKTMFSSRKHQKRVAGLILTSTKEISIGREKKRSIKSLVYKFINNDLDIDKTNYLAGYLAYINSVEPKFTHSLRRKYSDEIINKILNNPNLKKGTP